MYIETWGTVKEVWHLEFWGSFLGDIRTLAQVSTKYMATNYRVFHNEFNDDPYWEWLQLNPDGYVVNPKKNQKTKDFKYHRPNCMHIAITR